MNLMSIGRRLVTSVNWRRNLQAFSQSRPTPSKAELARKTVVPSPLLFKVAPHILEDLGLNLYADLPRVLVEYVANAHDADADAAEVVIDFDRIERERKRLRELYKSKHTQWDNDLAAWEVHDEATRGPRPRRPDLSEATLPSAVTIEVRDLGHGMERQDLQDKFLVAGRRRRGADNTEFRSQDKKRILMGRKGLGKLAGFGVARSVTVITKAARDKFATKITINFDKIKQVTDTNRILIEEEKLTTGHGLKKSGTRIILSQLAYGPTGAKKSTISQRVAEHFAFVDAADFKLTLNGKQMKPKRRVIAYAWPNPETAHDEFEKGTFTTDDGRSFDFKFRMRFTEDRAALEGKDRGVRVYVNRRLASAPSLLGADTNMHGFRMTDYLDGVVHADFLDREQEDYIATDRQSLKWETPLLAPLYEQLSGFIKTSCYQRQKVRDEEIEKAIKKDAFTVQQIEKAGLSKKETTAAVRIGKALAALHKNGTEDTSYKKQFGEVISAMGRGEIFAHLEQMATSPAPELKEVIDQVIRLTAEQRDGYYSYVKGRIDGIEALKKIVKTADFKKGNNEQELHDLFAKNSWLIDSTFFELMTSNRTEKSMYDELEKELEIASHVPKDYDSSAASELQQSGTNKRPDLVFILGDAGGTKIVIVELKSPNTPLRGEHYRQLEGYIRRVKKYLQRTGKKAMVTGILIGRLAPVKSHADDVEWLDDQIEKTRNEGELRVYSVGEVLDRAQLAHKEIIQLWNQD